MTPVSDSDLSERQRWALRQMRAGKAVRVGDVAEQYKCSETTAKHDPIELRKRGLIEFEAPLKTGHWRLARQLERRKILSI